LTVASSLGIGQAASVAVGAALGGVLRWLAGAGLNGVWPGFPLGTLLVNCVGGLLIGAAMVGFMRWPDETLRLLLVTGFLGGFTTFSAFSAESLGLVQRGAWALALLHSAAHLLGALACTAAGFSLARWLWR
jgi:fluoride exporter